MVKVFLLGMGAMALVIAAAVVLALKVFRRGAQVFDCPDFYSHVLDGDPGRLIRDVQRDARIAAGGAPTDPMASTIRQAIAEGRKGNVLLLSGGGQWGAFGAGLFEALSEADENYLALPKIAVITGISTGSLQTMLLMVALDPAIDRETRKLAIARLVEGYSPVKESDVVDRTGLAMVPVFGSAAGTGPLRRRIAATLRPSIDGQPDERLIEAIKASNIGAYVGFVEAQSGLFRYADIGALARGAADNAAAVEALTAATMASSAMPVFHQQLRIGSDGGEPLSLYDGGTRRSVFFDRAMEAIDQSVREAIPQNSTQDAGFAASYEEAAPCVFVVRNGPTVRKPAPELNRKSGALGNGQRGYDLLVNESEIGAIASLRLNNPFGKIFLTTADQYDTFPGKEGENFKDDEMFKPAFMARLRELGRWKAARDGGAWWEIGTLDGRPAS